MPDIIFYDSMGWGMTRVFLRGVVIAVFRSIKEMDSVLFIAIALIRVAKP